ncbi:pyridoxal-phosphate-dependent aminotransferase family protein [Mucispirillum schaedleri]|jgi:aspartate aminotransferase-like enzyme|uniref:Serine-pyruvate aminotransferase n=1 Tax=Mucispirillum schaedleri ASF457 TaxID=1379858 RepID=V2QHE0_9BACT|nr:alanine--glyoxylate aminotransferase family protein [Mucispirillum schaedleri]MCX4359624.1 alanine--glyoxylate aminotransferase family protein [Mucispirillum schaedleri]USF24079.1 Serine-pyruvate aminotransferase [Mucispirillum schaedleri ASF457]SIW06268.1 Soluble hydrogenase, small subunit [Mucispirillum schaedleri ASF457]
MLKKYLITPGPVSVPEQVLLDMARPMIHHRTPEFEEIFKEARNGLKKVFKTEQEPLILASSGTGAMESAVINTLNQGDKVLVINGGKFGERWIKICQAYGINAESVTIEWGRSVNPADVKAFLDKNPDTKAVFVQGSETSSTVYHPVKELAAITKDMPETLLIVDGITSAGVHDTRFDEWGIDILITGSQKAFMLPPGLAFITLSQKAWNMVEKSTLPKFYFNLKTELKNQLKNTTAWTAGVSLIIGLKTVLSMMEKEGIDNVFKRHSINAEATRAAVKALGLKLLAQDIPSNAATGCFLPENIDGKAFVKYLRDKCGVSIAGGQDHLAGKILRISHLGYHDAFDTITAVSAIEMGLKKFGADIEFGKGVAAAQSVLMGEMPSI